MEYFETVITLRILSERNPFGDGVSLSDIDHAITDGDCVGQVTTTEQKELTAPEVAQRLRDFDSEPGFFMLDDDGNEADN